MFIQLNKKLTFEKPIINSDECGGQSIVWRVYKKIWGDITPISVAYNYSNYISETKATHKITLRYFNDIDSTMRIVYNNRIFSIKYILNIKEQNKYLEIICEEII